MPEPLALPSYDDLDELVDTDPIRLRDKAWELRREVDRLRTPPSPGELRGLDAMCAALHAAAETDPVVKEVAWRTFALIRAHREQSAEVDRLKAELAAREAGE